MHLDTVFTMIDYDKFTVHSAIFKEENNMNLFTIEYDEEKMISKLHILINYVKR